MHNLGTVIQFEITRTLKKKSFWLMALGFPLMMVIIFGIIFFSNQATNDAAKNLENEKFALAYTDQSGLVDRQLADKLNAKQIDDKQQGIDSVKAGKIDGYIYYPAHLTEQPVEVYGKDVGLFDNGRYDGVAKSLLSSSVDSTVSSDVRLVLEDKYQTNTTTYRNGEIYNGFKNMILPGLFLVMFYLIISFFGNQMLTSTTEEKENRVIEMILTTIESRTLIIGKILSLIVLAILQMIIIVVPALIGYIYFHDKLDMPALDLGSLPVDGMRIGIAAAVFAVSFLLFTGLLVAVGAAAPTAKEAGGFFGIVMMLIFGPLYAAPLFISAPESLLVQVLSYFPFTAPIPLLLRNATGNLSMLEASIAIGILAITAVFVMMVAVRTFRYGALEYSRKLSLREIFSWK